MWINVDVSDDMTKILQSSRYYSPDRVFTMEELLNISEFVHFYESKKHLNFIRNERNILYGFCYGNNGTFLDEQYCFYDVSFPPKEEQLGEIYDTVWNIIASSIDCPSESSSRWWDRIFGKKYKIYK